MSLAATLPYHLRPRREKLFGDGRPRPLDRNAKARIMIYARALMRRTEKGKAYGADHRQGPGRARGAAVGLPQRPQRPLLPVL